MTSGPVQRPDRARLRQGQHLDRAQDRASCRPGYDHMTAQPGQVRPAGADRRRSTRPSRRWRWTTSGCSAATGRPGDGMTTLIFDCDGVLADTERYGHLPSFNQTFEEFGLPWRWSEERYGREARDRRGQGADGQRAHARDDPRRGPARGPEPLAAEVARWHKRKTALYTEMVAAGRLPPRPGIRRIITDAQDAGWTLAVASTSAEPSVRAILDYAVGPERAARFDLVLAGDVVATQEARPGDLPARRRAARRRRRPRCSWSRTPATACSPPSAPGCAA